MSLEGETKSKVKVVVRTRPTANFAQGIITLDDDKKRINIFQKKKESAGAVNNQQENWTFVFDKVLHNANQQEVYGEAASDVVSSVLEGYNGTIMAYGQTGAGKTFTMTGTTENYKHRGIIPRAIEQVFKEIRSRLHQAVTVRISYLEIYNESLYDLLSSLPTAEEAEQYKIVEDGKGNTHVKGLTQQVVTNEEEALNLLFEGETNRAIGSHQLNKQSSRSHCIFTIYLEIRSRVESSERVLKSKLNLVDLAGSERIKKTNPEGTILKEALYINKTLSFLEQVVSALAKKNKDHVPYRQTFLTNVLKDSLGGNCKTTLVANVWVESTHLEETISTLKFATRMMQVSNDPRVNVQYDLEVLVKKMESEIKELKNELSMHDALANRGHIQYDPYTEEQRNELNQTVRRFLNDEIYEIEVESLRQVKEIFFQFKIIMNNMESAIEQKIKGQIMQKPRTPGSEPIEPHGLEEYVGESEGGGFGVGLGPKSRKKQKKILRESKSPRSENPTPTPSVGVHPPKSSLSTAPGTAVSAFHHDEAKESSEAPEIAQSEVKEPTKKKGKKVVAKKEVVKEVPPENEGEEPQPLVVPPKKLPPAPDRNSAFEMFKKESETHVILLENKEQLKDKKKLAKEAANKVNKAKKDIDIIMQLVEKKQQERRQSPEFQIEDAEVIDDEEYDLLTKMKDLKQQYRSNFDQVQSLKTEVDYLTHSIDRIREKLLIEFETWFQGSFEHPQAAIPSGTAVNNTSNSQKEPESQEPSEFTEDVLDYQEKFDRMAAEKILQEDPESTYFYNARKNVFNVRKGGTPMKKQSSPNLPQIKKSPGNKKASPFK